jgi:hypothetical protein
MPTIWELTGSVHTAQLATIVRRDIRGYNRRMPAYAYVILGAGWLIWMTPFFLAKRPTGTAQKLDRRARWGILLVAVAYSMLWQSKFWERSLPLWRIALSVFFLLLAALLSWTGVRALGRQWRIDGRPQL